MNKVACYCGTRNLYPDMVTAAKSLLIHSDVDTIYFLIEDDEFPYELPQNIKYINVSHQAYFRADSPNFSTHWTYMVLMRAALTKIFPNLDRILSLDIDTIVNKNISNLWEINLDNYYLAAAKEPIKSTDTFMAINMGVVLFNLRALRDDHKDDEIIKALNTTPYDYNEQDCIAEKCQGCIYELSPNFNVNNWCDFTKLTERRIIHFAATKDWNTIPLVKKYASYSFNSLPRNCEDLCNLDIIIPAYKDKEGLRRTLKSICYPEFQHWIKVTIVDDCSNDDYSDIMEEYPNANFFFMPSNCGPGAVKNFGRAHTNNQYIMFVDCGDIILSKYSFYEIKDILQTYSLPDVYQWAWINGEFNTISTISSTCTPGFIYKREFLDLYNIWFCEKEVGSYSNEDIGFNHNCRAICRHIESYEHSTHFQQYDRPIYKMIPDINSLTHKNNNEFGLTKQIPGLLMNATHCLNNLQNNHVIIDVKLEEANLFMVGLYRDYLKCFHISIEDAVQYFMDIRYFYMTQYKPLSLHPMNETYLSTAYRSHLKEIAKYVKRPNIHKFFEQLENNNMLGDNYG